MSRSGFGVRYGMALAGLLMAFTGCGWWWPFKTNASSTREASSDSASSFAADPGEQVLAGPAERPPAADQVSEVEPNDDFSAAQAVKFDETVRISGSIDPAKQPYDRDVFNLGPAFSGDRVVADLDVDASEDVVLGIFDRNPHLLAYIDPTSSASGPQQIDLVIREANSPLYAVAATRSGSDHARSYTVRVSVQRKLGQAIEHPQVLVLNFLGASQVRIGNRPPVDVPPFDAAMINPSFAGYTEMVIGLILDKVRAGFAGLNVTVYEAGDPAIPAGDVSTIYFGSYDNRLLGLADGVDPYNAEPVQSAILYTDTFAVFNPLSPTIGQISQVLANTASHEAGHLLGLRHTADPTDLMDTTATARQMMLEQSFEEADLNPTVLPIGKQDAPTLLGWAVGGELTAGPAKSAAHQRAIEAASSPDDFYIPREWLMDCSCTRCAHR